MRPPRPDGLAPGIYGADDLRVGDTILTGIVTVTASMIEDYAELSGDAFGIHMDRTEAARHGFSGRVAHGIMVLGLADGLKYRADARIRARASLGWTVKFTAPVLEGDEISARIAVSEIRNTGREGQCVVTLHFDVRNQDRRTVLDGVNRLLAYR